MKPLENPLKKSLKSKGMKVKDLVHLLGREISRSTLYAISAGDWVLQPETAEILEEYLGFEEGGFSDAYEAYQKYLDRDAEERFLK